MNSADVFLRSFFDDEIYFLSNSSIQSEAWSLAIGEEAFGSFLVRFFEDWQTILEHQKKFSLSLIQFEKIQKLYNMVHSFQHNLTNYPSKPVEYRNILCHPDWKSIQRYAKSMYENIRPLI